MPPGTAYGCVDRLKSFGRISVNRKKSQIRNKNIRKYNPGFKKLTDYRTCDHAKHVKYTTCCNTVPIRIVAAMTYISILLLCIFSRVNIMYSFPSKTDYVIILTYENPFLPGGFNFFFFTLSLSLCKTDDDDRCRSSRYRSCKDIINLFYQKSCSDVRV